MEQTVGRLHPIQNTTARRLPAGSGGTFETPVPVTMRRITNKTNEESHVEVEGFRFPRSYASGPNRVQIYKLSDSKFLVSLEMSGYLEDELEIKLSGVYLKIEGDAKYRRELSKNSAMWLNSSARDYSIKREIQLKYGFKVISVDLKDGMLDITVLGKEEDVDQVFKVNDSDTRAFLQETAQ